MKSRLLAVAVAAGAFVLLPATGHATAPRAKGQRSVDSRISIELRDADIRDALAILAETSRLNFIVDDDVSGRVTLRFRNVTWREALQALLSSRSLGIEQVGNIVRVAPLARLAQEAELKASAARHARQTAPLRTRIIPVSYAKAADMVPHVKATLSERGTVTYDERTNVLIVRDIAE